MKTTHSDAKKRDLSAFSHLKFWSEEIQAKIIE